MWADKVENDMKKVKEWLGLLQEENFVLHFFFSLYTILHFFISLNRHFYTTAIKEILGSHIACVWVFRMLWNCTTKFNNTGRRLRYILGENTFLFKMLFFFKVEVKKIGGWGFFFTKVVRNLKESIFKFFGGKNRGVNKSVLGLIFSLKI